MGNGKHQVRIPILSFLKIDVPSEISRSLSFKKGMKLLTSKLLKFLAG